LCSNCHLEHHDLGLSLWRPASHFPTPLRIALELSARVLQEVEVPETATGDRLGGHPVGMVNVDGEVALIVLRASGGTCRLTYGAPGMTGVSVHGLLGSVFA
jgi:protein subunit release factor B